MVCVRAFCVQRMIVYTLFNCGIPQPLLAGICTFCAHVFGLSFCSTRCVGFMAVIRVCLIIAVVSMFVGFVVSWCARLFRCARVCVCVSSRLVLLTFLCRRQVLRMRMSNAEPSVPSIWPCEASPPRSTRSPGAHPQDATRMR